MMERDERMKMNVDLKNMKESERSKKGGRSFVYVIRSENKLGLRGFYLRREKNGRWRLNVGFLMKG